ncbi:MAG: DNA recombination protein RmuC [Porticoccaceae bacterium]
MDSIVIFLVVGGLLVTVKLFFAFLWYTQRTAHKRTLQDLAIKETELAEARAQLDQARRHEAELSSQLKVAEARTEEQLKYHQQLNDELKNAQTRLQKDFEALSNKLYEDSRKKFESDSQKTLSASLDPLKKEIEGFRKRIEDTHREDVAGRSRLEGQIKALHEQASQIGQDAVQLTNALKGESKSQGNWGEMVLERLLEDSGLEKGREYETQASHRDEDGRLKQPDVIIRLPEGKDIVIDSKVSLKAYESFYNAETEAQKEKALKEHINSLRNHFSGLSAKNYEALDSINSLDFVFMFVPIESAYTLALQADQSLFQAAYDRGVVIVSPTTLMATLRTVANIWRYEKQNRYAQQIADEGGKLYDQFVLLVESLDDVGKKIEATQSSYELARKRLSEGRGNLVGRVENLKKLGAKSKKNLPDSVKGLLED